MSNDYVEANEGGGVALATLPEHGTLARLDPVHQLMELAHWRAQFDRFVDEQMTPGKDYGRLPGTQKCNLFQPGAEKLKQFYNLSATYQDVHIIEDFAGLTTGGEPLFYYRVKCQLWRDGNPMAEADASCNSWEDKYRYRESERKCPECGAPSIIKGKAEYGGGHVCFKKKGGCGAKFSDNDSAIVGQQTGKMPNDRIFDQVNTLLAMAQKRAFIRAVKNACSASDRFTTDMDDYVEHGPAQAARPAHVATGPADLVSVDQLKTLYRLAETYRLDARERSFALFNCEPEKLTKKAAATLLEDLEDTHERSQKESDRLRQVAGKQIFDDRGVTKVDIGFEVTDGATTYTVQRDGEGKVRCNCDDFKAQKGPRYRCVHIWAVVAWTEVHYPLKPSDEDKERAALQAS